jgi:hypothetical protein
VGVHSAEPDTQHASRTISSTSSINETDAGIMGGYVYR